MKNIWFYSAAAFILALSLGLILFSSDVSRWLNEAATRGQRPPRVAVAQVNRVDGQVFVRRRGTADWERLPKGADLAVDLFSYDRLLVHRRATVAVRFVSGDQLSLSETTHALIEAWDETSADSPVYLTISQGNYVLDAPGTPGRLFILMNQSLFAPGQRPDQAPIPLVIRQSETDGVEVTLNTGEPQPPATEPDSAPSETPTDTPQTFADEDPPPPPPVDREGSPDTLTNQYIDEVIASQRLQFQKCQANALREDGQAGGQIVVGLTIEPSGAIEKTKVLQSTLKNKGLETCVLSVFERTRFNRFTGPPIVRSYPLNFE